MDRDAAPEPKRVTPTEARAKLLHSLITQVKTSSKPEEREHVETVRAAFIQEMLRRD